MRELIESMKKHGILTAFRVSLFVSFGVGIFAGVVLCLAFAG